MFNVYFKHIHWLINVIFIKMIEKHTIVLYTAPNLHSIGAFPWNNCRAQVGAFSLE